MTATRTVGTRTEPHPSMRLDRLFEEPTKTRRTSMLLANKNAVIYGAGGATAGAVARAFAREGASVFLSGRRLEALEALAKEILAAGGMAETARVDALDERGVEEHVA